LVTHYDKKTIDDFQLQLKRVDADVPSRFSLRGVVEASLESIRDARDRHISWDTIATVLQQSAHANGHEVEIHATTVRKYFVALTKRSRPITSRKAGKKDDRSRLIVVPPSDTIEALDETHLQQPELDNRTQLADSADPEEARITETSNGTRPRQPEPVTRILSDPVGTPAQLSNQPDKTTELETPLDPVPSEVSPTEAIPTSSPNPGWTRTGWTEPTFNRNRARPKQGDNHDS
jgi:hypothetical protein